MNVAACLARQGHQTLLIDLDPQAQLTAWLGCGDGLSAECSVTALLSGSQTFDQVLQHSPIARLSFIAASDGLEPLGRALAEVDGYAGMLAGILARHATRFDYVLLDSPNQVSPVMEMAIVPADAFIIPFESTKAVKSVANLYKLIFRHRPDDTFVSLHVSCNLTRQPGLRRRVLDSLAREGLHAAPVEISSCGWLARADDFGGSIFGYRPHAHGARDIASLTDLVISQLAVRSTVAA
jgi:chromosome partitioning protein